MLFGGVAWSELPISTQKQAVPNGDEVEYEGVIKALMSEELEINSGDDFSLEINLEPSLDLLIKTGLSETLLVNTEVNFELEIDPENEWSLS